MSWSILFMTIFLFALYTNPTNLVLLLVFQTMPVMMIISENMQIAWMNYIIVLVFLGGLLVIFTYLTALIPNEYVSSKKFIITLMIMMVLMTMTMNHMFTIPNTTEMLKIFNISFMTSLLPAILIYLLSGLFVVMGMTKQMKNPLKQF